MADVYDDPDRLRRPIRRVGAARRDLGGDRLGRGARPGRRPAGRHDRREHGADAIGVYLGNPNAHSVGFATHGVPFVKSLRTRNRFSASTVDQIPHQFVAWQMYGHQLLLPVPDIDRTSYFLVLGANPMASNGSLMTVPDFPQRVRDLKARGGRMVVLDPRRTETAKVADRPPLRPAGLGRGRAAGDAAACCSTRGSPLPRRTSTASTGSPSWSPGSRRSSPSQASGIAGGDDPAAGARVRRGRVGGGVRTDGGVDPRVRVGVPVGHPAAQPADRQLRPGGRRAVPRARGRHRGPAHRRPGPPRRLAEPGARRPGVRRRAAGRRRCARRSRRPATGRSGRW